MDFAQHLGLVVGLMVAASALGGFLLGSAVFWLFF